MLISISKKRRSKGKKVKSPASVNRSLFLKVVFGKLSGTFGNDLMAFYASGNDKFKQSWSEVNAHVLKEFASSKGKSKEVVKEDAKKKEAETKLNDSKENKSEGKFDED
jgi:hypothetical protein